jgi:hypothetical protein
MIYAEYLATPEWKDRAKAARKRAGYRCQVCNANNVKLNTHHRTYERIGHEDDGDLIVLCEKCHALFHGKLSPEMPDEPVDSHKLIELFIEHRVLPPAADVDEYTKWSYYERGKYIIWRLANREGTQPHNTRFYTKAIRILVDYLEV